MEKSHFYDFLHINHENIIWFKDGYRIRKSNNSFYAITLKYVLLGKYTCDIQFLIEIHVHKHM